MAGKKKNTDINPEESLPEINEMIVEDDDMIDDFGDELDEEIEAELVPDSDENGDNAVDLDLADDEGTHIEDADFDECLAKLVKKGKSNKNVLELQYIDEFFKDGELTSLQIDKLYSVLEENEIDVLELDRKSVV